MKHPLSKLLAVALCITCITAFGNAVDFITPRAFGPVISRNDLLAQYEYYIDKAGTVQAYIALFDGKNSLRLSPEAAELIARQTAQAIAGDEQSRTFAFDRGNCTYQVSGTQRSLIITPTGDGIPVTLKNGDIDEFIKNCADAKTLATSWLRDALKIAPAPQPESVSSPQKADDGEWAESIIPESIKPYVPASVIEYANKAKAGVTDLYEKDQIMTVSTGILAALCLLFFFLARRHKKNAYRVHAFGQEQLRRLDLQRQDELASAASQINEMAQQIRDAERGGEEQIEKVRRENTDNAVIFADTVAALVRMRETSPQPMSDLIDSLAKRYGNTEPGQVLQQARERSRSLAAKHLSAQCSEGSERYSRAACAFITDMFNMKTDQAAALVNNGQYENAQRYLQESAKELNSYGRALLHAELSDDYIQSRSDELKALHLTLQPS